MCGQVGGSSEHLWWDTCSNSHVHPLHGGHHSRGLLGGRVPSPGLRQAAFQGRMRVKGPGRAPGAEHDKAGETHRAQGVKASRPLLHPLGTKTTSVSASSPQEQPSCGVTNGHHLSLRPGASAMFQDLGINSETAMPGGGEGSYSSEHMTTHPEQDDGEPGRHTEEGGWWHRKRQGGSHAHPAGRGIGHGWPAHTAQLPQPREGGDTGAESAVTGRQRAARICSGCVCWGFITPPSLSNLL